MQDYGIGLVTPVELAAGEAIRVTGRASREKCLFTSNNVYVASVLQNGKIIANAPGFAQITVMYEDGGTEYVYLSVRPGKASFPVLINRYQYVPRPADDLVVLPPDAVKENKEIYLASCVRKRFLRMCEEACRDNIRIIVNSGYRSVADQIRVLKYYAEKEGISEARRRCAPPGYSEHHSGLALDVGGGCLTGERYAPDSGAVYDWIDKNCHRFGFMVKNLPGKEHITGTKYEPWHIRYIGDLKLARYLHRHHLTLDEYLDSLLLETREILPEKRRV